MGCAIGWDGKPIDSAATIEPRCNDPTEQFRKIERKGNGSCDSPAVSPEHWVSVTDRSILVYPGTSALVSGYFG